MSDTPRCLGCGDRLAVYKYAISRKPYEVTADHQPPSRGHGGDNLVCTLQCAQLVVSRVFHMAHELGVDLKAMLPPEWRPDLVPWAAWEAAWQLDGRRAFVVPRKK